MTLQEVRAMTGLSRTRLSDLIRAGKLPSRLELTPQGKARRLVLRSDVERLLLERQEQAQTQKGPGRRPRLPQQPPADESAS